MKFHKRSIQLKQLINLSIASEINLFLNIWHQITKSTINDNILNEELVFDKISLKLVML